jgi:geranylgeranyl diphosphate synthase type II
VTAPGEADASTLVRWIESRRHAVEAALERYVPAPGTAPAERRAPPIVAEAMRYSLLAGGKRLRPLLALGAAEAVAERLGHTPEHAMELALPAACALEFIHTYSLVHDDLPAMDNDTMRRGRPTAHVVFGEGIAILAGDALLTDAFSLLAREPALSADVAADELSRRKLETVAIVAEAAGAAGMVGGQTLDLLAVRPDAEPLDGAALREMHMRKTGALIIASSLAGAVMGGATPEQLEAVGRYALQVGLAFQIVDDILDVEGVEAEIGKTPGKDAAAGKPTYPALYGLDESKRLAAECVTRAIAALDNAGLSGQLPAIARWVVGRTN